MGTPLLPLRLLVVTKHFLNQRDAQAQQSVAVVDALSQAGANVDVLCGGFGKDDILNISGFSEKIIQIDASLIPEGSSIAEKILRKLLRNLSSIYIFSDWGRRSSIQIRELEEIAKYDCIISLGLPMDSHIAVLRSKTKCPWLAYFSDPWPEAILPAPMSDFSLPILSASQKQTVRKVIARADAIGFSCREQISFMGKYYANLDVEKCFEFLHVAPSSAKFTEEERIPRQKFTIVYAGAIGRERVCPPLAHALNALSKKMEFELHFLGAVHEEMKQMLKPQYSAGRVVYHGWLQKDRALSICRDADALLMIESDMAEHPFLPSKVADYSATGRPIIAVTGANSPSARLISSYRAGVVCAHKSKSIQDGLELLASPLGREISSIDLYREFTSAAVGARYYLAIDGAMSERIVA